MGADFYTFEMLTGRRLTPLPVSVGDWSMTVNADETISCSMKASTIETARLKVWEFTTLARNGLLAVADGVPVAAGPIFKRSYKQGGDITLTAGGLRSYWDRRIALPAGIRGQSFVDAEGDPITSYDFSATNLSLGTIAKRYVELALAWPGGNIPMVLPADLAGTHERTEPRAIDLKTIRKLLDDLTNVQNGPDIAFRPRWASDGLGIYWEMQVGTEANPRVGATDPKLATWTIGAERSGAFGLSVEEDGTGLAEEAFVAGGASTDRVVIAQARNTKLANAGYPLLQSVEQRSGIGKQTTAQSYANRAVVRNAQPASFWKASVRAVENGSPRLGDYWLGDLVTLTVDPAEPVIPPGDYVRRIAKISGDAVGDSYDLVFSESVAAS